MTVASYYILLFYARCVAVWLSASFYLPPSHPCFSKPSSSLPSLPNLTGMSGMTLYSTFHLHSYYIFHQVDSFTASLPSPLSLLIILSYLFLSSSASFPSLETSPPLTSFNLSLLYSFYHLLFSPFTPSSPLPASDVPPLL